MTLDGAPIPRWSDLIRTVGGSREVSYIHSTAGDRVLSPGDELDILYVQNDAVADSIQTHIERLVVELCYCSVYDECWRYVKHFGQDEVREPVPQCRATPEDFGQ